MSKNDEAMQWWNNLSDLQKTQIYEDNTKSVVSCRVREKAIQWWDNLHPLQKTQLCDTNFGISRGWGTLTGSEIEKLYDKENNDSDNTQPFLVSQIHVESETVHNGIMTTNLSEVIRLVNARNKEEAIGKFVLATDKIKAVSKLRVDCIKLTELKNL